MARAIYPHELGDPDFAWLISNFRESNPDYVMVEVTCLPVALVAGGPTEIIVIEENPAIKKGGGAQPQRKEAGTETTQRK